MSKKKFGKQFLTWLLAATMVLTMLPVGILALDAPGEEVEDGEVVPAPVAGVEEEEAAAGDLKLTVGFKVRMNPRSGVQIDKVCFDGETLDVDPSIYAKVYIRPYLVVDGNEFEAPTHPRWGNICYTFEYGDYKNNASVSGAGSPFNAGEKDYSVANAGNWNTANKIIIDDLSDERLNNGTPGEGDYYTLTVKAYELTMAGDLGSCLGTVTAKLHVRMTFPKPVLHELESYHWDANEESKDFRCIDPNLENIYSSDELIKALGDDGYDYTYGFNEEKDRYLDGIWVSWAVTEGTEYSDEPGAVNSLTWTANLESAPDYEKWTIPEDFECSRAIQFQNPFAVRFMDGETVLQSSLVKKDSATPAFGENPTRSGYTFVGWEPKVAETVTENVTYVAQWKRNSHRPSVPSTPTVEIPDEDALGLNMTDHFAYIVGYPDGTVQPNGQITRAEATTIFFRLLTDESREANLTKTNGYTDVASDAWYNTAVSTMTKAGIVDGYPDGTFRPDAPITRAEMAKIISLFAKLDKSESRFSDIAGHWAEAYIRLAAGNGWIAGYPDGTFLPQRNISRAEAMTLVNRVLNRKPEAKDDLLPAMKIWTDNLDPNAWYYLAVQEATNSHYYKFKTNSKYEKWTELRETRDWSQLEK